MKERQVARTVEERACRIRRKRQEEKYVKGGEKYRREHVKEEEKRVRVECIYGRRQDEG